MQRTTSSMRGRLAAMALLLGLGLGGDCGPKPEEVGGAVLLATPIMFAVGLGFVWILWRLWRRLRPELPMSFRPAVWALPALTLLAVLGLAAGGDEAVHLAVIALWLFGTGYLALLFVLWRVWLRVRPEEAFTWSAIAPLALLVFAALPMVAGFGRGGYMDGFLGVSLYVGGLGGVPGAILLALLIEIAVRLRRRRAD